MGSTAFEYLHIEVEERHDASILILRALYPQSISPYIIKLLVRFGKLTPLLGVTFTSGLMYFDWGNKHQLSFNSRLCRLLVDRDGHYLYQRHQCGDGQKYQPGSRRPAIRGSIGHAPVGPSSSLMVSAGCSHHHRWNELLCNPDIFGPIPHWIDSLLSQGSVLTSMVAHGP